MRLVKLLVISSIFISCADAPKKPELVLGIIDYPANEVIQGTTSLLSITRPSEFTYEVLSFEILNSPALERVPLSTYDKAICQKPDEYLKLKNYIDELEIYIDQRCN